jgi:nuclear pore complex protein Nup205
MAAVFEASHFEKLHRVLKDAIASPARVSSSNDWYIAIDRSRAELVDIARAKRPNDAEKREIQSGELISTMS